MAIWTIRRVDQMCVVSSEMWWWRGMDISWTNHVINEEILHRAREKRNILYNEKKEGYLTWQYLA